MKTTRNFAVCIVAAAVLVSCSSCGVNMAQLSSSAAGTTSIVQTTTTTTTTTTTKPVRAYDLYTVAQQTSSAADGMDANIKCLYDCQIGDSSIKVDMSGNVKATKQGNSLKTMSADLSMLTMGQTVPMEYYYSDGIAYVNAAGTKYKQELSVQEMADQLGIMDTSGFSESDLEHATTTQADGVTTITAVLPASAVEKAVGGSLSNGYGQMDDASYQFHDVTMTMRIDEKGNFMDMRITCSVDLSVTNDEKTIAMTMKVDMTQTMNNIGQPVTITPPADLDSYVAIDGTQPDQAA